MDCQFERSFDAAPKKEGSSLHIRVYVKEQKNTFVLTTTFVNNIIETEIYRFNFIFKCYICLCEGYVVLL